MKWVLVFAILSWVASSSAQTAAPTATEVFNLRIRCKELAAEKFESLRTSPLSYEDGRSMGMTPAQVDVHNRTYTPQEIQAFFIQSTILLVAAATPKCTYTIAPHDLMSSIGKSMTSKRMTF
jgi:hypothetical protein